MAGAFVWYTLMAKDVAAAGAFYGAVVGFQTREAEVGGRATTLLLAGDVPTGVIAAVPEGRRPAWLGFIGVDDADACVARLAELGGAVHHAPTEIPDIGRYAVVADPQGAVFLLLQRNDPGPPAAPPGTPGRVAWHELMASDWAGALAFYRTLFGWTEAGTIEIGRMGTYQMFATGGHAVGGMMNRPPAAPVPVWLYYIEVDTIDGGAERVLAAGGSVLHGPTEVPGGLWIIQAVDPQGAFFALVGPRR